MARLMDAGYGGQLVVSSSIATAVKELATSDGLQIVDQGDYQLRGVRRPERLFLLAGPNATRGLGRLRIGGRRTGTAPTTGPTSG
jgi:class 3 adenylate cyclase